MSRHTEAEIRRAQEKYLEECASACPHCRESRGDKGIRRVMPRAAISTPADERPTVKLACYCAFCWGLWTEVYRLEGVDLTGRWGEGHDR